MIRFASAPGGRRTARNGAVGKITTHRGGADALRGRISTISRAWQRDRARRRRAGSCQGRARLLGNVLGRARRASLPKRKRGRSRLEAPPSTNLLWLVLTATQHHPSKGPPEVADGKRS